MTGTPDPAVQMPGRVRALDRDDVGRPVPWFAQRAGGLAAGARLRLPDPVLVATAVTERLCWVCGQRLPRAVTFVLGPIGALQRESGEPPMHTNCATYALQACPRLLLTSTLVGQAPGPVVFLAWNTTEPYSPTRTPGLGPLVLFGAPDLGVQWWCGGRVAAPADAAAALEAAWGRLCQARDIAAPPVTRPDERWHARYASVRRLLPA